MIKILAIVHLVWFARPLRFLLHGQGGGEVFVEGEEVFYALAVAGEGGFAVAAVHGAVEGFVGFG